MSDLTSQNVRKAISGDRQALAFLYLRFTPPLLAEARARLAAMPDAHLEAQDLVQVVWQKAIPRLGTFEFRGPRATPALLTYLSTFVMHEAQNWNRKRRVRSPGGKAGRAMGAATPEPFAAADDDPIWNATMNNDTVKALAEAIHTLSHRARAVFDMSFLRGMSDEAITTELSMSLTALRVTRSRVKAAIQESFAGCFLEDCDD